MCASGPFALMIVVFAMAACVVAAAQPPEPAPRNAWYREALLNIHCDNHSGSLGQGQSVDDLTAAFGTIPCDMIQVSAQSNGYATYPTLVGLLNPDPYDTVGTFREVTRRLGRKLCIYMSVDRRPMEVAAHPDWFQIGADGKPTINSEPVVCQRPNRDHKGYLYERFIPQIQEVIAKFDPDGLWFDGDYILTQPCWCERCLEAWREETGTEAPRDSGAPNWRQWTDWHYARYQEYRRLVAQAIHEASPKAMYASNWSWAWGPEPAPDFVDTFSGDAWSIKQVLLTTARWGGQQRVPWDIMSFQVPDARALNRSYSLQRTFQEGALTIASGGIWFAWTFGGGAVPPQGIETTRWMGEFVQDRKAALGPSVSLSSVAVLDPETTWERTRETGYETPACNAARSLLESGYTADIVNEVTLAGSRTPYRVVVVGGQRFVAPQTVELLRRFAEAGGLVLVTGQGLRGDEEDTEAEGVAELLGLRRVGTEAGGPGWLELGGRQALPGAVEVASETAQVVATLSDGRAGLTVNPLGAGAVAYLAAARVMYPDDGLLGAALRALGRGPSYAVEGAGEAAGDLPAAAQARADHRAPGGPDDAGAGADGGCGQR